MEIRLKVCDLIEMEKMIKFIGKNGFQYISLNERIICASNGYVFRQWEINHPGEFDFTILVDTQFKTAVKALLTELKKYPDQIISIRNGQIGFDKMWYSINFGDMDYPSNNNIKKYLDPTHSVENYFRVNLKALKIAIESMNEEAAYFILPEKNADMVIIRDKTQGVSIVGVKSE